MTPKPAIAATTTNQEVGDPRRDARPVTRSAAATAAVDLIAPQLRELVVPISSVELHPRNPRLGDVAAIAASLTRFGQQRPIVVQASTRFVLAGNHLVRAARSLGWTAIAANVVDLDDARATAFLLADNRTSDLGGYDDALLAAILAEQAALDNLAATGYDRDAVAALVAAAGLAGPRDADACPELPPPDALYVRPGDVWALGAHRLVVGDATDPEVVRLATDGEPVDLVWTDPPYGVRYVGKTGARLRIANDDLGEDGTRRLVGATLQLAPLRPAAPSTSPRRRGRRTSSSCSRSGTPGWRCARP